MAEDGAAEEPPADAGTAGDPLARLAAERDRSREELLADLLDAPERLGSLDERLGALEDDVDEKIRDVRERVIQVKREADAKAPADHDHPHLVERLDGIADDLEAVRGRLDAVEDGFENYESLLEHLLDESSAADRKLTTLASALLDLRERADALAETAARRSAAASLAADANREGVRRARCEECGEGVDIGLLREPNCPHCDAQFSGVAAARGFLGSSTLETGTPPALEPGDGEPVALDDVLESGREPPADTFDEDVADPDGDDAVDGEGGGFFGPDDAEDDAGDRVDGLATADDEASSADDSPDDEGASTDGGTTPEGWDWVGDE